MKIKFWGRPYPPKYSYFDQTSGPLLLMRSCVVALVARGRAMFILYLKKLIKKGTSNYKQYKELEN